MWYRQGRSIVVLPGRNGGGAEVSQELAAGDREVGASYTQCDFIDSRIDVAAQRALFQMLRRDAPSRSASLGLFAAVKAGRLVGLYQEDQQVPALRARRMGIGWWQVIPSGQRAVCLSQPSTEPPIIIFKKSLASDVNVLSDALLQAWPSCGLPQLAPPQPSGRPCPPRPAPPLPKPPPVDVKPPSPTDQPQAPPPAVTCSKDEYARRVNQCVEDAKRCVINAHKDLGLDLAKCVLDPFCNAKAMGKYLLALRKCRDAIVPCDQQARRDTNCP
jgi:hypothetical protein